MARSSATVNQQARAVNTAVRSLGGLLLCLLPLFMSSSTPPTLLEQVQADGFLRVISLNGPSTFYEGPFGHAGFEYELASAFADELGVELTIVDKGNLSVILNEMGTTDGHFAAAGLSIIEPRKKNINFTIPYSTVTQKVIYQRDAEKPKTVEDLLDKKIIVVSNSSHAATLRKLKVDYPTLTWQEEENAEMSDMLEMVHNGEADISIVDSTAFITNRVIYPRARSAFAIAQPENIAWAFPKQGDDSLLKAANTFIKNYAAGGKIAALEKKYFSKAPVNESNALVFAKRIEERLPQWEKFFQETAKEQNLDWLFLAAISYQESFWNKDAKSFTGVRGLMMLTRQTAKGLGIKNREDPLQSIQGGAKYFVQMRRRVPSDIEEPDKTWMALAAYNVGLGHLEDARVITQRQGGNPDLWKDVEKRLPLLTKRKYYKNTRHGYARGWEPVKYVRRIRNYHNILIWHYDNKRRKIASDIEKNLPKISDQKAPNAMSQL
ncbi:MAG: membrane-bound lytic murein transglycosylase F [Kiritimatiellia bacterium]|jgi:membrane-bound lytic murein transglycosylase F